MSLPSRERELKPSTIASTPKILASLPSRERELKQAGGNQMAEGQRSLPSRERELKRVRLVFSAIRRSRSPRGSAN